MKIEKPASECSLGVKNSFSARYLSDIYNKCIGVNTIDYSTYRVPG